MEKSLKNKEKIQKSRSLESDSQSDSSQNADLIDQEHGKIKDYMIRIEQILSSERSDRTKVEECLQVIKGFSKNIPSKNEAINEPRRPVQGQHIQPIPLHSIIELAKTRMEELQSEANQLRTINIQMKKEIDKLTEQRKSLKQRIQGLDIGQYLRQTKLFDSLGAEQARLEKRMSAEEKEETSEEDKIFAILDKMKEKYEEALNKQNVISEQLEGQSALLQEKASISKELEETNSILKKQNNRLVEEYRAKDQQLKNQRRRQENINIKLDTVEKQNKKLKEMLEKGDTDAPKIQELQLKIKELNEELTKKKTEGKKQESIISELTKQNSVLKKEITHKNDEVSKHKDEIKRHKDSFAGLTQQYQQAQGNITKNKAADKLKQEVLRRNSALQQELLVKNDEVFSLSLRHRDQINNQKEAFAQLTKKHQQAQEENSKLKAAGQPSTLQEMHHMFSRYLNPTDKKKNQMVKAEKDEILKKKQQFIQSIGFL